MNYREAIHKQLPVEETARTYSIAKGFNIMYLHCALASTPRNYEKHGNSPNEEGRCYERLFHF